MIRFQNNMDTAVKTNLRGGEGSPTFRYLFSQEELGSRADLLATITLQPGDSIGVHPHAGNGEIYLILSGAAMVEEDGVETELKVGDAEFCADGHTHGVRNHTDAPMTFLAVIIKDCQ